MTFANRSYAQQAIRLMHHSQTMEVRRPTYLLFVVRFSCCALVFFFVVVVDESSGTFLQKGTAAP